MASFEFLSLKWFARVEEVLRRQAQAAANPSPLPRFDFDSLRTTTIKGRLLHWLTFRILLRPVFAFLRAFVPVLRVGRLVIVSRHADVTEVLANADGHFPVVYGPEMTALGGADGVLGLDGVAHGALRAKLESVMRHEDLVNVSAWARDAAEALLHAGKGRIDIARDLITRAATEVCCRYFGITAPDPDAFAEWTMAISVQLFADPAGTDVAFEQARIGAVLMGATIDNAIARAQANHHEFLKGAPDAAQLAHRLDTAPLIERLLFRAGLTPAQTRAAVIGMATGFVPTNTLAAGNMFEELRRRPALWRSAVAAATALGAARSDGDTADEADAMARLTDALLIAGRYNPALSPGIWRHCPQGGTIRGARAGKPVRIAPGSILLVSVFSALRDARAPGGTPQEAAALIFGSGPHSCLGARIALAQIAEVLAALLARPGLARARGRNGRIERAGPFPVRWDFTYDCPDAVRALLVCAVPLREGVSLFDARATVEALGNPLHADYRADLDAAGRIQFVSINVVEDAPGSDRGILLVELNGDGRDAALIAHFAEAGAAWLSPIMALTTPDGSVPRTGEAIAALLADRKLDLHRKPWGATGLHFDGLGDLSVADIARQERVAHRARALIDMRLSDPEVGELRAMDMLSFVRRVFQADWYWCQVENGRYTREIAGLPCADQRDVTRAVVQPSRRRLALADWKPPRTLWEPIGPMLRGPDSRLAVILFAASWALLGNQIYRWVLASEKGVVTTLWHSTGDWWRTGRFDWPIDAPGLGRLIWAIGTGTAGGFFAALLVFAAVVGMVVWRLRALENSDEPDDRIVSLADLKAITSREDAPGYEQNHIIALMPLKRGLTRKLTFAFSFWWIKQSVTYWFRPGFVATMGTIHKARWFRIPGTRQFVFHSNYDGTWESYLEDFITRVAEGQTSAWSHGVGFPPTRFLVFDGAKDGDRFKRWVRRQQRPTQCWYSRFPALTAAQIRRNALIEDGLARAASDTDARRWLAHFGSAQREPDELESQEVQAIVFNGLGKHRHATAIAMRLPTDARARRDWLRGLLQGDGAYPDLARITFGDLPFAPPVAMLGLTAHGLRRFGIVEGRGFDQLPGVFAMGMAARARLLGDESPDAGGDALRFSDAAPDTGREDAAEAVLVVYGPRSDAQGNHDPATAHARLVGLHTAHIAAHGGSVVHAVPCSPPVDADGTERPEREHFGFRDGISQPFIRGSRRESEEVPARDVVAAGEFILGYRNHQGYVSPAIGIGAEHDPRAHLPTVSEADTNRYPFFGNRSSNPDQRDFGRNGTFLVLRQLDQDVERFWIAMQDHADRLNGVSGASTAEDYPKISEMIGHQATAPWLAAKVIGRWQDGTPLVGNAARPAALGPGDRPDNDFTYGIDDPRGYACPLGAHIRRTNPRDSLEPGDPLEQRITNRHRILRRGRSYHYTPPDAARPVKGLLFAALCADLERQFEFVQHTWVNASSFHGLSQEADPLLGNPLARDGVFRAPVAAPAPDALTKLDRGGPNARFTIPTIAGPVVVRSLQSYVTLRGGGYFFLPSRSALRFMLD